MPDITLNIAGQLYGGWTGIRVMRSLETIADAFELTLTERWAEGDRPRPIKGDTPCELWHGTERLVTGYVDEVQPDYDDKKHSIVVTGRSKAGDLVDCSITKQQWRGRTLLQITQELAKPFGIAVRAEAEVGAAFKKVAIEPGQTIFEFIEKLARIRAVRLVSDAAGNIVITRAGQARVATALVLGENIRAAGGQFSSRERFSDYIVMAQQTGDDNVFAESAAHVQGAAKDTRIGRYRPTVILADGPANAADCKRRAEWSRNTAYGRGQGIVYTVSGWEHADGLWAPNRMVPVRDPWMDLDEELLIVSVQFLLDEKGKRTELRVMPREAFDLVPLPEPKDTDGSVFGG